jgi:hypothetical protein
MIFGVRLTSMQSACIVLILHGNAAMTMAIEFLKERIYVLTIFLGQVSGFCHAVSFQEGGCMSYIPKHVLQ